MRAVALDRWREIDAEHFVYESIEPRPVGSVSLMLTPPELIDEKVPGLVEDFQSGRARRFFDPQAARPIPGACRCACSRNSRRRFWR